MQWRLVEQAAAETASGGLARFQLPVARQPLQSEAVCGDGSAAFRQRGHPLLTAAAVRSFYNNANGWGAISPPSQPISRRGYDPKGLRGFGEVG
jgi:hypothetical protein